MYSILCQRLKKYLMLCKAEIYFTKLDFMNAYNPLVSGKETRRLLAWSTHRVCPPLCKPVVLENACLVRHLFNETLRNVGQYYL